MSNAFEKKIEEYGELLTIAPWEIEPSGIYKYDKGEGRRVKKYPIAIIPVAILENVDTGIEKLEMAFFKNNRWRTIVADRSVVASKNTIVKLADKGIEVNTSNSRALVDYLSEAVTSSLETIPHKPAKTVLGWISDGGFAPYSDDIVFDGEDQFKHLYESVTAKGDMALWLNESAKLRKAHIENRLCMAASFASPLVEMIGENSFVYHLYGGTGSGKTVVLMLAMSIWGDPAMGKMTRTMNMTQNAMLSTAAFLRNLPFAGDELQTIKTSWGNYDKLIMSITEGIDRGRMSYDRVNEMRSWRCSFLFTGEEPCVKAASGGGVKNRVIEIECKDKLVENGNATVNVLRNNYGLVGRLFIDYVKDKQSEILQLYQEAFNAILEKTDTTDKQAGAMAIMLVADRIASQLFWPDEDDIKISDIAQYLSSKNDVDITERAYSYIIDTIARNANRFGADDRDIWGRIEKNCAYVNRTVLDEALSAAGYDFDAVKSKWRDKGYLVPNTQGKLFHHTKCHGIKASYIKISLPTEEPEDRPEGRPSDETMPF